MAKILIIDDDVDLVESMRLPLEAVGHQVETAQNGTLGLQKVKTFEPDLIILDVMMESDTEGFHVAYQLRSEDPASEYRKYARIPILMVTAIGKQTRLNFSPERDQEFLPVNDYLEKPIQPEVLLKKVDELVHG